MSTQVEPRGDVAPSASPQAGVPRTEPVGACPLCAAPSAPVFFSAPDRQHGTPGEFTYKRCGRCGTVFQDPRVVADDLWLCYPAEYLTHHAPPEAAWAGHAQPQPRGWKQRARQSVVDAMRGKAVPGAAGLVGRALARLRPMRERAHGGLFDELRPWRGGPMRALDAGCGAGGLLVRLTAAGWHAEGVEIDPLAVEVARRASGCPVRAGDFRTADLPRGAYDLVVLSHVFEHVADPVAALRRLRELLAPGGRVVLIYPNPDSFGARVFGAAWFHWDPPRHLVVPRARALADAATRVGFARGRLRTAGPHAHFGFRHSRAVRAGRSGLDVRMPPASRWDVTAARAERVLTAAGLPVGDEVVLTLWADA